jgi:hypothetical protein
MADLTSAGVTLVDSWSEGGVTGKRALAKKVTLVLTATGTGGAGAKIPAAALGMASIEDVSPLIQSTNAAVVPASPNAAGNEIILGGGTSGAAAVYTGTFTCIVRGQSAP